MRSALTTRDATRIYRELQKFGYSQQAIAALVGQSQPEVSAVIHGRRIMAYDVIYRMVDGLGAPKCLAGVNACCNCCGHERPDLTRA
jgi:antitoxin component HigA of HigAB toxin-antitoxin module